MRYAVGDILSLERNPIYASSASNARLTESVRVISEVSEIPEGRILIRFEGSKVWYSTHANSEWIGNIERRYRNLNFELDTEAT